MAGLLQAELAWDSDDDDTVHVRDHPKKYILPKQIFYGYHKDYHGNHINVSEDGSSAEKQSPTANYARGVVYSDKPLEGLSEFEVTLTKYGTGWSGNLKLGIAMFEAREPLKNNGGKTPPRYSPDARNHCVWCDEKIHDKLQKFEEKKFGLTKLDDLREGDRLGLQILANGTLSFYVNGEFQGVALSGVYKDGYDIYAVVDHYGNAIATAISKAVSRLDINLQEKCLDAISSALQSKLDLDKLPLPDHMKDRLKLYSYKK